MSIGRLEILVEPFKEDDPGPHVMAVVDALSAGGFDVDFGPFATTATGSLDALIAALQPVTQAGFAAGATGIQTRLDRL